jgi:serine/threonine-protein kinase
MAVESSRPGVRLHPPSAAAAASAASGAIGWDTQAPSVGIIEPADAPSLAAASCRLRQGRLRAAAAGLAAWSVVVLVRMTIGGHGWARPAALVVVLAAAAGLLSRRATLNARWLRVVEFALFGLVGASFAAYEYEFLLAALERGDAATFHVTLKNGLINALTLLLAYAVLIPNTWATALPVVAGLAAYPALTVGALSRRHPEAVSFVVREGAYELPGLNVTMMAVGAALALYGIHVLATLRAEAFEARRLSQYRLGSLVGFGGMGEVYRAEHRLLKRTSAIKLIHPKTERDPAALAAFEREVRATARIAHPNIVEIYDYGQTEDGTFYYVMEYLEGLNLGEIVRMHGPMEPGRVVYLLSQACEGLAEAHAAGLIHRDLKPANLFAARLGRRHDVAKLLDFGLVLDVTVPPSRREPEGGAVGTLPFMAPEQRAGLALDHRADVFSLGAVAYYLLTGRLALADEAGARAPGDAPRALPTPVPPSQLRPDVPADLEAVILRCLSEAPAARYPDAESLRDALAACASAADWDAARARDWWRGKEEW